MAAANGPTEWSEWGEWLSGGLHGRCRWRLRILILGMLLAQGRRTSWLRAAGIHHNPTPGPADAKCVYGHIWVTLALLVRPKLWGTIGLPLLARLYVRRKDLPKLPKRYRWPFQTKLELAVELIQWLAGFGSAIGVLE
ncbi:MAG: hypothetical protein NUV77_11980 [Thermoguttaceae bacterium]|nr:hypothetical protein [Thermoguttaceae bacterium]